MFVIIHPDRPDIVIDNEEDMYEKLQELGGSSIAYRYFKIGYTWYVRERYYIVDNDVVTQSRDTSVCLAGYETYKFPNPCLECGNEKFMAADRCLLCSGDYDDNCLDCGKTGACECQFNDY
jgi:hypothetical protein